MYSERDSIERIGNVEPIRGTVGDRKRGMAAVCAATRTLYLVVPTGNGETGESAVTFVPAGAEAFLEPGLTSPQWEPADEF